MWTTNPPSYDDGKDSCSSPIAPTVATLDVFSRHADDYLWRAFSANSGANWTWSKVTSSAYPAGRQVASAPSAITSWWGPGRRDVFVRGTDNQLWQAWSGNYGATWTWYPLGENINSAPSVVSWGSGRLDIFARAANNTIRHRAFDANSFGWGPWEDFGGTLASGPSAVSWGSGRLDAFIWNTTVISGNWRSRTTTGPGQGSLTARRASRSR
jgi:hypothetical protein